MSVFRNRLMKTIQYVPAIISIADSMAGDVCLYDKVAGCNIIVSASFRGSEFPPELYSPVGVVVVPGIHSIYGENTCSVISLVEMSCVSPTTGVNGTEAICVAPQADMAKLPNYNVVIINDGNGLKTGGFGYLSKNGQYNYGNTHIPDPYNADMTRNPDYYNTTVSPYNAMSDFAGVFNTNMILGTRGVKNYSTWSPTATTATDYPAASCCDMYYTEGTVQGQWFLPGAGEWGYVMSKWDLIQASITKLNGIYGNNYTLLANNASYWTSSEHNAKNNRYVHTDNGMGHTTKTTASHVRAFCIIDEPLQFPLYLYTSELDADFFRRKPDRTSRNLIHWFNKNSVLGSNGSRYVPSEILAGKVFIDDYEVTSMELPNGNIDYILFETDNTYGNPDVMKVFQYKNTSGVERSTIDIM
jgi:hypothetical protein